jgi:hypothetical protein
MRRSTMMALLAATSLAIESPVAFAQGGGGGGGGGSGGAAGGSAGTGDMSTGVGRSTGESSTNTVGQTNISPSNPATTQPSGPNSQPVPNGTVSEQNAQQFDPRLSPGYQK